MTYPQYQPPQQPSYPQYGAPAPAPQPPQFPQQQYAPQYAPQPSQGQPITPPMPGLRDGGGGAGGSVSPKMRHLVGRTVIVEPVSMGTATVKGQQQDEARFHLTVVDGGPVRYGDNVDDRDASKNRPNTHERDVPCRFTNVTDIGYGFVQVVREMLDGGEHGRVGVIEQGTLGNRPYLLTRTGEHVDKSARPDGQQRFDAAMAIFGKIWADKHAPAGAPRQFISPEPRSLVAPPAQQAPPVNYGAPQQQYGAPTGQAYTAPQAYYGVPAPVQQPAYPAGYGQFGALPPQLGTPPTPAPSSPPLPEPVEAWLASLPADQTAGARAQYVAQMQGAAAPAGPGM